MLRNRTSQSASSVITVDQSDSEAKSATSLEVKRLTKSNSRTRVYGFSPNGSQTSDSEKEKTVSAEGYFELSDVEFGHDMQEAILASIKESYQPSENEEKRKLISSEKTEENSRWMSEVSSAVFESVDGLKTDLKNLSQQLQEPCQKLLTMYLDNADDVDETDFDVADLSEEEQELLNISNSSHEVKLKGIPSIDQAITPDERWLLDHNDAMSSRDEEPSSYGENRSALFAKSYINQQRIKAESKKSENTQKKCIIS